jgi:hypothetical protein
MRGQRSATEGGQFGVGLDWTGGESQEGTAAALGQDGTRARSRSSSEAGRDGRGGADAGGGTSAGEAGGIGGGRAVSKVGGARRRRWWA